jgi:hypothetical protein
MTRASAILNQESGGGSEAEVQVPVDEGQQTVGQEPDAAPVGEQDGEQDGQQDGEQDGGRLIFLRNQDGGHVRTVPAPPLPMPPIVVCGETIYLHTDSMRPDEYRETPYWEVQ